MCDISLPIGAFFSGDNPSDFIPVFELLDINNAVEEISTSITASVVVKIDSFSLMVVAYSSSTTGSNLIGIVGLIMLSDNNAYVNMYLV